mgnify:CR=1 FL=1
MPYIPVAFIGRLCMIPIAPTRDRNSTGHTERTDGRLCAAPGGGGIHAFAFLPIRYSFLYRTCLQPPSPKTVLKVFHLYRYKKSEKLSPENQIFQKNLRAAETAPKREKNRLYYCIELRKIKPAIGSGNGIAYHCLLLFAIEAGDLLDSVKYRKMLPYREVM